MLTVGTRLLASTCVTGLNPHSDPKDVERSQTAYLKTWASLFKNTSRVVSPFFFTTHIVVLFLNPFIKTVPFQAVCFLPWWLISTQKTLFSRGLYARAFIFIDPSSHERMAFAPRRRRRCCRWGEPLGSRDPEVNVDTWAATEMIIQGVEERLHAWFQGWKGRGRMGGKRVRWINGERLEQKLPKRTTFIGEMTEVGSFSGGFLPFACEVDTTAVTISSLLEATRASKAKRKNSCSFVPTLLGNLERGIWSYILNLGIIGWWRGGRNRGENPMALNIEILWYLGSACWIYPEFLTDGFTLHCDKPARSWQLISCFKASKASFQRKTSTKYD